MPFCVNKSWNMSTANRNLFTKVFIFSLFFLMLSYFANADEKLVLKDIRTKIENISKDLKTLEKAFYKTSEFQTK